MIRKSHLVVLLLLCLAAATARAADQPETAASKQNVKDFLNAHNEVRQKYNLPPLVWDKEVSRAAHHQGNVLIKTCTMVHTVNNKYGENLFWGGKAEEWDPIKIVYAWANESLWWDRSTLGCAKGPDACGHFTQMVWYDTQRLGCKMLNCLNTPGVIGICEYDPPGNYPKEDPLVSHRGQQGQAPSPTAEGQAPPPEQGQAPPPEQGQTPPTPPPEEAQAPPTQGQAPPTPPPPEQAQTPPTQTQAPPTPPPPEQAQTPPTQTQAPPEQTQIPAAQGQGPPELAQAPPAQNQAPPEQTQMPAAQGQGPPEVAQAPAEQKQVQLVQSQVQGQGQDAQSQVQDMQKQMQEQVQKQVQDIKNQLQTPGAPPVEVVATVHPTIQVMPSVQQ